MKKIIITTLSSIFLLIGCGSTSADEPKVEINGFVQQKLVCTTPPLCTIENQLCLKTCTCMPAPCDPSDWSDTACKCRGNN